jgi:hypothetical protein
MVRYGEAMFIGYRLLALFDGLANKSAYTPHGGATATPI